MALLPSRTKFRKSQRGSRKGIATSGNKLDFGDFGLQTLERGWIKNNQIEACRVAITRFLKRKGKVFIRIFPHKPVTQRPPEVRMGKGKGCRLYPSDAADEERGDDLGGSRLLQQKNNKQ